MGRRSSNVRAPFVTTVTRVAAAGVLAGLSLGCGPNPPAPTDCPLDRPQSGDSCDGPAVCYYDAPGCEGTSARVRAACVKGEWTLRSYGVSCNPPFPYDSGAPDVTPVDAASCPETEPAINAACSGSATCSFANLCPQTASSMPSNTYRCIGDRWSFESTLESPIDCPKIEPRDGEACGCAMYLPPSCSYSGDTCGTHAVCDGATQRWEVRRAACDAGPEDAGAAPDASAGE